MISNSPIKPRELEAIRAIRNWIAREGRVPTIRELMGELGYKSPRSAQDLLDQLASKGVVKKNGRRYQLVTNPDLGPVHSQTVSVPVLGTIAAGTPIFAEQNIEGFVPVSVRLARPGSTYFLLHVGGDSMNEVGINDGDLVLVREQHVAEEGEKVVALIDDSATVKEFHRGGDVVILKPRSSNKEHKPIILDRDFRIQGIVVATIPTLE
jgi:repressor LexA